MGTINYDHVQELEPKVSSPLHIRWMIRADLTQVLDAEVLSEGSFGWKEQEILAHLRDTKTIGMVVESAGQVVGHMIYVLHPEALEILRLVTHPDHRGRGVGSTMIEKLKSKLSSHRRNRIFTHVPLDPEVCCWYRGRGFVGSWDGEQELVRMVFRTGDDNNDG